MKISPEERKQYNAILTNLMEASQRSLVSLRKDDMSNLTLDIEQLAVAITAFMVQADEEILPGGLF